MKVILNLNSRETPLIKNIATFEVLKNSVEADLQKLNSIYRSNVFEALDQSQTKQKYFPPALSGIISEYMGIRLFNNKKKKEHKVSILLEDQKVKLKV